MNQHEDHDQIYQIISSLKLNRNNIFDNNDLLIQGPNPGHEVEDTSNSEAAQNEELLSQQCLLFE